MCAGGGREDDRDRETWGLYHQSQERQPGRCRGTPTSRCESVEHIISVHELLHFYLYLAADGLIEKHIFKVKLKLKLVEVRVQYIHDISLNVCESFVLRLMNLI